MILKAGVLLSILVGLLVVLPLKDRQAESLQFQEKFLRPLDADEISVASFNIRLDAPEHNESNHFRHRVKRLADYFDTNKPMLVGLQEPFISQILHLKKEMSKSSYSFIGDGATAQESDNMAQRMHDFQTAIMYDSSGLELLQKQHSWLSRTPQIKSKDWGSGAFRTVTTGVFRDRRTNKTIVLMNTHLDVFSTRARQNQAQILRKEIEKFAAKYPESVLFVTGDFNCASGSATHRSIVGDSLLHDLYDVEEAEKSDYPATFHGWLGYAPLDKYLGRVLHYLIHAIHSLDVQLPRSVRWLNWSEWKEIGAQFLHPRRLYGNLPSDFHRMHVDWILGTKHNTAPTLIFVNELRAGNFSSDHFVVQARIKITA
jgi:endonuclease/exonuclease/phosphatase family metal-dependent hydrolase